MKRFAAKIFKSLIAGSVCLSMCMATSCKHGAPETDIIWNATLQLPPAPGDSVNIGVAGAFAGICDNTLMVAGGANFPDGFPWTGAKKVWHRTLYSYDFPSEKWNVYPDFLPEPLAYGVSITLPEGIMLIGGNNADGGSPAVYLLSNNGGRPELRSDIYPKLPFPLSNSAGALVGRKVFLAGGICSDSVECASHAFVMLDLDRKDDGWQILPPWPGPELGFSVAAAADGKFYMFGGRDFGPDKEIEISTAGFVYDPVSGEWNTLEGDFPVMAATALNFGGDIWLFGGVEKILPADPQHPGFSHMLRRYNPSTGELTDICESPYPLAVTTTAVAISDSSAIIASGEERPGVRTPMVLQCTIKSK